MSGTAPSGGGRDGSLHGGERVVRSFIASVALFALLAAGVAYASIVAVAEPYTRRAKQYAAVGALAVALIATLLPLRTPRPFGLADVSPHGGHPFSCPRSLTPASDVARGAVDVFETRPKALPVKASTTIDRGAALFIGGWASDAGGLRPVAGVCFLVDGRPLAREAVSYGSARPDVAQAFKQADLVDTGYEIRVRATDIPPGWHEFTVVGVDEKGRRTPIAPPLRAAVR